MEGHGVTSYNVDKPTYAFSTATTEFDDALLKRGTISLEDAMAAKGASASEAQRLAEQARSGTANNNNQVISQKNAKPKDDEEKEDSDDDSLFEDDDDDFLQKYRTQRLAELKQEAANQTPTYGELIPINRPEWKHHVNDASQDYWVVVTLTCNHAELTGHVEAGVAALAQHCPSVKFVTIPSTSAIANWPDSNLPSIFVYRHGEMAQELVRMKRTMTPLQIMEELASAGVEFEGREVQDVKQYDAQVEEDRQYKLRRRMRLQDDEEDVDDEVI